MAILGAAGTIGPAIVRDLAGSEEVAELLLLDLDEERAARVAREHGGGKARVGIGVANHRGSLADAVTGCDVLVNSASYRVNVEAMRACLNAGCHYLDLGGLYWMTSEQMHAFAPPEGRDEFEAAGLLALLGMGSSPGKTNVMAARGVRELSVVERVDVAAAGRDLDPPPGFSVPYALRTLIDELTMAPVVIRGGEPVEIEPLSGGGSVDFGDPIGHAETIHTLHSEMRTFADSFGCREASFRLSLAPELVTRLGQLSAAGESEIERAAAEAKPPSPHTVAVHVVEVAGGGRRVRVRSVTGPAEGQIFGGGVVSTAAPAAAAVRLLARGRIAARGVLPPESCVSPDDLLPELERRGSAFEMQVAEEVRA